MVFSISRSTQTLHENKHLHMQHGYHLAHDVKMHAFFMTYSFTRIILGACQNFGGAAQQFLCLNPFTAPHSIFPATASVAGTTEQWISAKASSSPAQLTIFYAGTVNVLDGISSEKAQAIMLLAANTCASSDMAQLKLHVQALNSKLPAEDEPLLNQTMNVPPCSRLPSPTSVSSYPIDQPGVAAANSDDIKVSKSTGIYRYH